MKRAAARIAAEAAIRTISHRCGALLLKICAKIATSNINSGELAWRAKPGRSASRAKTRSARQVKLVAV
jgi:hypothetical protein